MTSAEKANAIRASLPPEGLFADKTWRIAPEPFALESRLHQKIVELGPRLHAFNKACNLLYRQSHEGKQPRWIREYLDAGKPEEFLALARNPRFKNDLPLVIRPDILLTPEGFSITELDSVPGGIGLTAWLQQTYSRLDSNGSAIPMAELFLNALKTESARHHPGAPSIAIVVSKESQDYRPEMEWLAALAPDVLTVCGPEALRYQPDGVFVKERKITLIYRFFELFDLPNIAHHERLLIAVRDGLVGMTPPLKPHLEEKLWFALFWFPQLAEFWRRELGDRFFRDLKEVIPFTWILDPRPLPPQAVFPHLNIHSWEQMGSFSQKERDLILKISGFSELAWGSRGVHVGSDMPQEEWQTRIQQALAEFEEHPYVVQRFAKTKLVEHPWHDFETGADPMMKGRMRLCPYYFVENDKPHFAGILATLCPADKKLIHGMKDAVITLAQSTS